MSTTATGVPWVIIQLESQLLGVSASHAREMVPMPAATRVPQTHGHVRGVINLRGRVLPLIDMRQLLGMPSALEVQQQLVDHEPAVVRTVIRAYRKHSCSGAYDQRQPEALEE